MSKPLSRPHELGRAIGYNLDPSLLLEELKRVPVGQWGELGSNRAILDYVQSAVGIAARTQNRTSPKRMWLVVKLENQVPVMIDAYTDKASANRREKFLRQHLRAERDEVKMVAVPLRVTAGSKTIPSIQGRSAQ